MYARKPTRLMTPEQDKQQRFLAAYDQIHEGFVRYCSAIAFGRMPVEDLVQDCLLGAYRKFDELLEPEKLQCYMVRMARNRTVSVWRSSKYKAALTQVQSEEMRARGVAADDLVDIQLLYRAIHQLPGKQRDAVLLYDISGYSQREIASVLNCSEPAVKMLLQRGRKGLRKQLTDPGTNLSDLIRTAKSIAL